MIIKIIKAYLSPIKLILFQNTWRKRNPHNETTPKTIFDMDKVSVGKGTYGELLVRSFGNKKEKLNIGHYCSIASNVVFHLSGEHDYTCLSTYPFRNKFYGVESESISKGPIQIDDDVWIGEGCIILSGVHIGQGAVIGAGSVVARNIPPYAVYGNGKILKYRFSEKIIKNLLNLNFDLIDFTNISYEECSNIFYKKLDDNILNDTYIKNWMKKVLNPEKRDN